MQEGTSAALLRYAIADRLCATRTTDMPTQEAILYRMGLPDHVCPYGVRAKETLEAHGFAVEDRILASRGDVDAFKAEHDVATMPQVFIDGERIGGSDELDRYFAA